MAERISHRPPGPPRPRVPSGRPDRHHPSRRREPRIHIRLRCIYCWHKIRVERWNQNPYKPAHRKCDAKANRSPVWQAGQITVPEMRRIWANLRAGQPPRSLDNLERALVDMIERRDDDEIYWDHSIDRERRIAYATRLLGGIIAYRRGFPCHGDLVPAAPANAGRVGPSGSIWQRERGYSVGGEGAPDVHAERRGSDEP